VAAGCDQRGGATSVAALVWTSSFVADVFDHQPALGDPLVSAGDMRIYAPWKAIEWSARWADVYPRPFAIAQLILLAGFVSASIAVAAILRRGQEMKPFAKGAWGGFDDAAACGLFASSGAVPGKLDGEVLCFDGSEHQLLIGASRSGKGRGPCRAGFDRMPPFARQSQSLRRCGARAAQCMHARLTLNA
jgi:type IV secretion system protein VirD4